MEKLLWEIALVFTAAGGVGGLWMLQNSTAQDAVEAARQAWRQQTGTLQRDAALREQAIQAQADEARTRVAESAEVLHLQAAARAVEWEGRIRAAEEEHFRKSQHWKAEKAGLEQDNKALAQDAGKFRPDYANMENLRLRLQDMQDVWLDNDALEADCQKVLAKNLWVLAPDYIVGKYQMYVTGSVSIATVMQGIFPNFRLNNNLVGPIDGLKRPDLCGWVEARTLSPSATQSPQFYDRSESEPAERPERIFLVVELKRPSRRVTWRMMEQVHAYAWYLVQNIQELQKHRVECLVIGGDCTSVNDAHLRWGKGPHDAIRIVPISYRQLYSRACAIAKPYLDKKFGNATADGRDINVIDAVPELEQGETIADQFARKSTSPQEDVEEAEVDEDPTPPQSDLVLASQNDRLPVDTPFPAT